MIHLWWRLTWINTVGQLEFLIIVSFRWRDRMLHPYKKKNILKTHLIEIVIFLLVLTVRYVMSLSSSQNIRFLHRSLFHSLYFMSVLWYIHYVWLYSLAIKLSGDIGENPGPKPNSCDCFSIFHWNLNSISTHNFIKLSLLCAYISINKTDIICLSWNLLRLKYSTYDDNLELPAYAQIILLILKEAVFAFIIIFPYPWK